jgi:hypothetical protein
MFPAGVTEINSQIAVEKKEGTIYYVPDTCRCFAMRRRTGAPFA